MRALRWLNGLGITEPEMKMDTATPEIDPLVLDDDGRATLQLAFTRVVRGLRAQGWKRSAGEGERCAWLSEDGCRCALGHLMEGDIPVGPTGFYTVRHLVVEPFRSMLEHRAPGYMVIRDLFVGAHDNGRTPEEMETAFRDLGTNNNLQWPEEESGEKQ